MAQMKTAQQQGTEQVTATAPSVYRVLISFMSAWPPHHTTRCAATKPRHQIVRPDCSLPETLAKVSLFKTPKIPFSIMGMDPTIVNAPAAWLID